MKMRYAVLNEIFLYLQKVYYSLDRDWCLGIPEGYRMIPRAIWLLQTYSGRIAMVEKDGGYHGPTSKGFHRVTQRDPLFPTILNSVVNAVMRHWEMVVAEEEAFL